MLPSTHAAYGRTIRGPINQESHHILAFADARTQTFLSGPEIQRLLGYPDGYLLSTNHQIRGITDNRLRVKGVLFLLLKVGSRETRQAIYVSDNTPGFYLSQTALKDRNLLHPNSPASTSKNSSTGGEKKPNKLCGCPRRTPIPSKPDTIPF